MLVNISELWRLHVFTFQLYIDFDPAKCGTEDCTFQDWDEWFSVSMEFNELPSGNSEAGWKIRH